MNRGIETFFRECFDGLHPHAEAAGIKLELIKGGPLPSSVDEHRVWCLPRTGLAARTLGKLTRRNGYVVEQMSFLPGVIRRIRRDKPQIILSSDGDMGRWLHHLRRRIGVPFRFIYSNGAPMMAPFGYCDHVQQVTPFYLQAAIDAGEKPLRHSMVPYGIRVPQGDIQFDPQKRAAARRELQLPVDRQIVLSVGWIAAFHKRMDYLIDEIASLAPPRPYLVMLGAMDEQTPRILRQAREKLGDENFAARSVPYEQVSQYYQAADVFTLCSLREGFGRVYLEALMYGLPCAVHDHPVMRWVLGSEGAFDDFSTSGNLARILKELLAQEPNSAAMSRRRQSVRERFDWNNLAPSYFEMFRKAAGQELR
jgi:1,2-diacylglycerol 3-alpha-glucosyltransferase